MDNGQQNDTSRISNALVLYQDDKQDLENDSLARRLKNRERQRRYRARKRHEADLKKALKADQSTSLHNPQILNELQSLPVQVEISVNVTSSEYLTRVHCRRDWKKDARGAPVHKKQEIGSIGLNNSDSTHGGTPAPISQSDLKADLLSSHSNIPALDSNATHKLISNKRHWKVEARNKKRLE